MGKKGDLNDWDFPTQPSAGFTENDKKQSSLGENAFLMKGVRGEWPDCFMLIRRQR